MNISQQKSREIAKLLMAKKFEQYEKLKSAFSETVRKEYLKTVPKEVVSFFGKHPTYVETSSSVTLAGNGFSHTYVTVEKVPSERNGYTTLSPDKKLADSLTKEYNRMIKSKSDYDDALNKVAATLFALRTYNRIKEQFPEATEHLPPAETKAELMNIGEVRKLVK